MKTMRITMALVLVLLLAGNVMADEGRGGNGGVRAEGSAQQSQLQGQTQGQTQGIQGSGNSGVTNSGNSGVEFTNSFNGSEPIRYLPIPSNVMVNTEGGPSYFGGPPKDNGAHFMSMKTLVNALNAIDTSEAKIDDESDIEFVSQVINARHVDEIGMAGDIKFHLLERTDVMEQFENFKTIAVTTMKADDNDTINSATLAVKLKKEAEKYGATKIVLVTEGTSKRISSWGVGIGFSQNYGFTNSGQDGRGGASAGGTGWSWGESEFFSLPYLTAILGY